MEISEVRKKIAYLTFANDQLVSELEDIDRLLKKSGFRYGLKSLKEAAEDIILKGTEEE